MRATSPRHGVIRTIVEAAIRRLVLCVAAAAALLAAAGCTKTISDKDIAYIAVPDAVQLMQGGRRGPLGLGGPTNGLWLDARRRQEYLAGHIPGAVQVPFSEVRRNPEPYLARDVIIVYGEDYNSAVALAMSKTLLEIGASDVRTLRGGFRVWQEGGNPVEKGEGTKGQRD